MNGYTLANTFRLLRESWRFTSTEADLYYELIGIANERGWPAGFQYSNQLICATIGISEKSLIAARNRLKQAGLLDFVSGHKRAPTAYTLSQKGLPQVSKSRSKSGSVSGSESDSPLYKELKQNENELEQKLAQERAAGIEKQLASQKKIAELEQQLKNNAQASHTKGAGQDWQYDPSDLHPGLHLPFDTPGFRQMWVTYKQYREEQKYPRLNGGIQEQEALRHLGNLAAGDEETALEIIRYSIRGNYKTLCKQDVKRPTNPQQHVTGQPANGAKPTGAAVDIAAALVARRFEQRADGTGPTGQTAGTNPSGGATLAPGLSTYT